MSFCQDFPTTVPNGTGEEDDPSASQKRSQEQATRADLTTNHHQSPPQQISTTQTVLSPPNLVGADAPSSDQPTYIAFALANALAGVMFVIIRFLQSTIHLVVSGVRMSVTYYRTYRRRERQIEKGTWDSTSSEEEEEEDNEKENVSGCDSDEIHAKRKTNRGTEGKGEESDSQSLKKRRNRVVEDLMGGATIYSYLSPPLREDDAEFPLIFDGEENEDKCDQDEDASTNDQILLARQGSRHQHQHQRVSSAPASRLGSAVRSSSASTLYSITKAGADQKDVGYHQKDGHKHTNSMVRSHSADDLHECSLPEEKPTKTPSLLGGRTAVLRRVSSKILPSLPLPKSLRTPLMSPVVGNNKAESKAFAAAARRRQEINKRIRACQNQIVDERNLKIVVGSWNVAQQPPPDDNPLELSEWLLGTDLRQAALAEKNKESESRTIEDYLQQARPKNAPLLGSAAVIPKFELPDIVVVCLQEVELGGAAIVLETTESKVAWTETIIDCLNSASSLHYERHRRILREEANNFTVVGTQVNTHNASQQCSEQKADSVSSNGYSGGEQFVALGGSRSRNHDSNSENTNISLATGLPHSTSTVCSPYIAPPAELMQNGSTTHEQTEKYVEKRESEEEKVVKPHKPREIIGGVETLCTGAVRTSMVDDARRQCVGGAGGILSSLYIKEDGGSKSPTKSSEANDEDDSIAGESEGATTVGGGGAQSAAVSPTAQHDHQREHNPDRAPPCIDSVACQSSSRAQSSVFLVNILPGGSSCATSAPPTPPAIQPSARAENSTTTAVGKDRIGEQNKLDNPCFASPQEQVSDLGEPVSSLPTTTTNYSKNETDARIPVTQGGGVSTASSSPILLRNGTCAFGAKGSSSPTSSNPPSSPSSPSTPLYPPHAYTHYRYRKAESLQLVGIVLIILVRHDHYPHINHLNTSLSRTGVMRGIVGNKGAIGARFSLYGKRFLFLGAHFDASVKSKEKRNANYQDAMTAMRFPNLPSQDDELDRLLQFAYGLPNAHVCTCLSNTNSNIFKSYTCSNTDAAGGGSVKSINSNVSSTSKGGAVTAGINNPSTPFMGASSVIGRHLNSNCPVHGSVAQSNTSKQGGASASGGSGVFPFSSVVKMNNSAGGLLSSDGLGGGFFGGSSVAGRSAYYRFFKGKKNTNNTNNAGSSGASGGATSGSAASVSGQQQKEEKRTLNSHDYVFFFGDLNYRLNVAKNKKNSGGGGGLRGRGGRLVKATKQRLMKGVKNALGGLLFGTAKDDPLHNGASTKRKLSSDDASKMMNPLSGRGVEFKTSFSQTCSKSTSPYGDGAGSKGFAFGAWLGNLLSFGSASAELRKARRRKACIRLQKEQQATPSSKDRPSTSTVVVSGPDYNCNSYNSFGNKNGTNISPSVPTSSEASPQFLSPTSPNTEKAVFDHFIKNKGGLRRKGSLDNTSFDKNKSKDGVPRMVDLPTEENGTVKIEEQDDNTEPSTEFTSIAHMALFSSSPLSKDQQSNRKNQVMGGTEQRETHKLTNGKRPLSPCKQGSLFDGKSAGLDEQAKTTLGTAVRGHGIANHHRHEAEAALKPSFCLDASFVGFSTHSSNNNNNNNSFYRQIQSSCTGMPMIMPVLDVREYVQAGRLEELLVTDQLTREMSRGRIFRGFHEQEITFPPTYKFDKGTKTYDTSWKRRDPAWTDRVLYWCAPDGFVAGSEECTKEVLKESQCVAKTSSTSLAKNSQGSGTDRPPFSSPQDAQDKLYEPSSGDNLLPPPSRTKPGGGKGQHTAAFSSNPYNCQKRFQFTKNRVREDGYDAAQETLMSDHRPIAARFTVTAGKAKEKEMRELLFDLRQELGLLDEEWDESAFI